MPTFMRPHDFIAVTQRLGQTELKPEKAIIEAKWIQPQHLPIIIPIQKTTSCEPFAWIDICELCRTHGYEGINALLTGQCNLS